MNGALIQRPLLEALGWTLLHFLWQGTLVAILLAAANNLLRKRTANARYALDCGAMLLLLVLPAVTFFSLDTSVKPASIEAAPMGSAAGRPVGLEFSDERTVGRMEFADVEAVMSRSSAESPAAGQSADSLSAMRASLAERARMRFNSLVPWLVFTWALGVLMLSVRFAGGLVVASRLKRLKTRLPIHTLRESVSRLATRLRVTRPVKLCESALIQAPAVIGWLRPVILIPATALTGLSSEQIEALLAHELAHIRRHDYLVNMLQSVVETLLFYHPAVWWVSRQVRLEREHCCDDLAVAACGNVLMYARALAELEGLRAAAPHVALAAGGDSLLGRIERLLGKPHQSAHQFAPSLGALVSIVAIFSLVAVAQLPSQKPVRDREPAKVATTVFAAPSLGQASRVDAREEVKREPALAPGGEQTATTAAHGSDRVGSSSFSLPNTAAQIADGVGPAYASMPANGQSPAIASLSNDKQGVVHASTAGGGQGVGIGSGKGYGRGAFVEGDGGPVVATAAPARGRVAIVAGLQNEGTDFIGEMQALGLKDLTVEQWIELRERGVTPQFVRGMKELGYDKLSVDELIHLRTHGVTPQFVRGLNDAGYSKLSAGQLIELRKHGVTPEFVHQLKEQGIDKLSIDSLVSLRMQGVSPSYIHEMQSLGYGGSTEHLISMRQHGVTPDYVHRMKDAGYDHLSADQLVSLRNHGVTPEFVGEMKKLGYPGLSIDQLISLRIHGVNGSYIADLSAAGYGKLTPEQLISLRMHGVTGAYIQKLRSHGFNNLTVDQLVKLRNHGIE